MATLRRPPLPNSSYSSDEFSRAYSPCPDPYGLPVDVPEPATIEEAKALKSATRGSEPEPTEITGRRITASTWSVGGEAFEVEADIHAVLDQHGPGVYTVVIWANLYSEKETVSEYAVFYEVTPPDTYGP